MVWIKFDIIHWLIVGTIFLEVRVTFLFRYPRCRSPRSRLSAVVFKYQERPLHLCLRLKKLPWAHVYLHLRHLTLTLIWFFVTGPLVLATAITAFVSEMWGDVNEATRGAVWTPRSAVFPISLNPRPTLSCDECLQPEPEMLAGYPVSPEINRSLWWSACCTARLCLARNGPMSLHRICGPSDVLRRIYVLMRFDARKTGPSGSMSMYCTSDLFHFVEEDGGRGVKSWNWVSVCGQLRASPVFPTHRRSLGAYRTFFSEFQLFTSPIRRVATSFIWFRCFVILRRNVNIFH